MKQAFTLAEVLITLGIIGIVAAMTMPSLIQNHRTKVTVTKLKKVSSILNNAFMLIKEDEESPEYWLASYAQNNFSGADAIVQRFIKQLKISKYCGKKTGCFVSEPYKLLNGNNWHNIDTNGTTSKFISSDGFSFDISFYSPNCSANYGDFPLNESCAQIHVDINGNQRPNQAGIDLFWFYMTKSGIYPAGLAKDTENPFSNCNKSNSGAGCAAWVIYNENMDYLYCNNLSWDGKKTCK